MPATTANLGPGFDCLGLALKLYNTVELKVSARGGSTLGGESLKFKVGRPKLTIEIEGVGKNSLPKNEENIVYKAVRKVFDLSNFKPYTLHLKLVNEIPLARGLGSSAAARIGGLVAANKISGNRLTTQEILNIATQLEGHPDNVVPAFFGGLCVSVPYTRYAPERCIPRTVQGELDKREINYVKLEFPKDLNVVVCIPELTISTEKARKILPQRVPLGDAVFNLSRVALLISALKEERYDLLKLAMGDRLHQPYRKKLIPGFDKILGNAYSAGAFGVALSGSGSSILAISSKQLAVSKKIGQAMVETFRQQGIKSRYLILDVEKEGIKVT